MTISISELEANMAANPSAYPDAMAALVEVSRTAIALDVAMLAFEEWRPSRKADDSFMQLLTAAREARAAHRAALDKVKP